MKRWPVLIVFIMVGVGLAALIWPSKKHVPAAERPLTCYVGGTMTPVMTKLATIYRERTGREVEVSSADSGELLATIGMRLEGDMYVAHDPFMDIAMQRGLGIDAWRLGELHPVLIVQKGNPKNIHTLADFYRPDVRVYLTDYVHSTLGNMLPLLFERAGLDFAELNRVKQIATHRSGSWVANQLIMKAADAALVWQVVAHLRSKDVDAIELGAVLPRPGIDAVTSATGKRYIVAPVKVAIVLLTCSRRPGEVREFVNFVASETGRGIFEEAAFDVSDQYGRQAYINGVRKPGP